MRGFIRRLAGLALCGVIMLWAVAAAASLPSLGDQNQQVYVPGSALPGYLQENGAFYQGSSLTLLGAGGQAASSSALSATGYWWYFTSGHYNVLMPGTAQGPYASYYNFAGSLSGYLGESYDSASSVLGRGNDGYGNINLWLSNDSGNSAVGWYYPGQGSNSIYLNLSQPGDGAYFGSVAAHETTHLILDHDTNIFNRDPYGTNWYSEALAYYVGNSVYAYGYQQGYSYNSAMLKQYSQNGATRADWYGSGQRYLDDNGSTLDWVQLNVIGYFLAHSDRGWSAIQDTVSNLSRNQSMEASLQAAYGMASGMQSIASGPDVNTLYSRYINYYLGHY